MSNIGSYEERVKGFDWSAAERELGYKSGEVINIGWYCADRICEMGKRDKAALLWEGSAGEEKRYAQEEHHRLVRQLGDFALGLKRFTFICMRYRIYKNCDRMSGQISDGGEYQGVAYVSTIFVYQSFHDWNSPLT